MSNVRNKTKRTSALLPPNAHKKPSDLRFLFLFLALDCCVFGGQTSGWLAWGEGKANNAIVAIELEASQTTSTVTSSSSSSSCCCGISMDGRMQAGTVEHVAAGIDSNVARSHSIDDSGREKPALTKYVEGKPSDRPLDAFAMLDDSDFAAEEKALVGRHDTKFSPCLWMLYFYDYLNRNNIA